LSASKALTEAYGSSEHSRMKIKSFFACEGFSRGPKKEYNIKNAGMTEIGIKVGFPVRISVPLFFIIQREPLDTEGPHRAEVKLFIGDNEPRIATFEVRFSKEDAVVATTGAFDVEVFGPISCRYQLALADGQEIAEWPFKVTR
jgi:hypothetical protein